MDARSQTRPVAWILLFALFAALLFIGKAWSGERWRNNSWRDTMGITVASANRNADRIPRAQNREANRFVTPRESSSAAYCPPF